MRHVLAFGAGNNSTALLIEIVRRGLPLDAIVFADTGGERPGTYLHIEAMRGWCRLAGAPDITTVRYVATEVGDLTLESELLRRGALPSIAYGKHYKSCSLKWKIEPQDKWLIDRQKFDGWELPVTTYIGLHADEAHRLPGLSKTDTRISVAPLVDWDMGDEECIASIVSAGLRPPGKSSCFFCPNMRRPEVIELRDKSPDLFLRALAIEDAALPNKRPGSTIIGLGRDVSWREIESLHEGGPIFNDGCMACIG